MATYKELIAKDPGWWENGQESDIRKEINKATGDVNEVDPIQNQTLLHLSITNNKIKITEQLLNLGINADAQDTLGDTALHYATRFKDRDFVTLLLKFRAEPTIVNEKGETPISIAFEGEDEEIIKMLLKKMKNKNMKNNNGETLLHIASKTGNLEMVQTLKNHEISMNEQNAEGDTALMLAIRNKHWEIVKYLIDYNTDIEIKNNNNETAIYEAVKQDTIKLFNYLKDDGANINIISKDNGKNLLHLASFNKNIEMLKGILECETNKANIDDKMDDGFTNLHISCLVGNLELYQYLFDLKVDFSALNNNGYSVIDLVAENGNFELMQRLIDDHMSLEEDMLDDRELVLHNRKLIRAAKIADEHKHFNIVKILNKVIVEDIPDEVEEEIDMFLDDEEEVDLLADEGENPFNDDDDDIIEDDIKDTINEKLEEVLALEIKDIKYDFNSEEILELFLIKHGIDKDKDKEVYIKLKNVYKHTIEKLIRKYNELRPYTIKLSKEMFELNFEEIESIDNTNNDPLIKYLITENITIEKDYEIYTKVVELYEKIIKELIAKFSALKPDVIKLAKKTFLEHFHDNEPY